MTTTTENPDTKRLFFGLQIDAPWPMSVPTGRILNESSRHLTLAFLGNISWPTLRAQLNTFPPPPFTLGTIGAFDRCHFLPQKNPRVVAWHVQWLDEKHPILSYQQELVNWLRKLGYRIKDRKFLPHMTIARSPFSFKEWRHAFHKLPVITSSIHLYESLGNLIYKPLWSHPVLPPFDEIPHTADLAFRVRGNNLKQVFLHAQTALTFAFPYLLRLFDHEYDPTTLDDIVIKLNELICKADERVGCPLKAVSFHGEVEKTSDHHLEWEMIIDV